MTGVSRRDFLAVATTLSGVVSAVALGAEEIHAEEIHAEEPKSGLMAASSTMPGGGRGGPARGPGLQGIRALCEVTGGGEKVYGIAVEYDAAIDSASLALDTYTAGVFPAARGFFPGNLQAPDKTATTATAATRTVAVIYTNSEPALRLDRKSVAGRYVVAEFHHESDLSLPTADSDKVVLTQDKEVRTVGGVVYAPDKTLWSNAGRRGNSVVIRGVDAWEQNHWWWDDTRSAWLEYSIYLPKSFLAPGGDQRSYPLVLAITHSGTSYDGTGAQTLTEQCIASIWSLPEEQERNECVVITPRYERTTMNDYWEHTHDVENTYKLVESMLGNTWNFGNPNLEDRRDKVLRIDPGSVYCTGWSMGAMTCLWLMAKHPETFAAGLIIAGQQRPSDVVTLAHQNLLIITGTQDSKATSWNEKCVPVWENAGAKVTRSAEPLDPALIFPVSDQRELTGQIESYIEKGGNITFLTFASVNHIESARKFFHIRAARDWLFKQAKR